MRSLHVLSLAVCLLAGLLSVASVAGCSKAASPPPEATSAPAATPTTRVPEDPGVPARAAVDSRPAVVFLGDSLTAGLGVAATEAYPSLVQQKLDADGLSFHVVNAGVSGDTSAGGLSRLDDALRGDVRVLVVALGGNDALRGLPVDELRKNLAAIIERAQARKIPVILAGMEAPPNFGESYTAAFHQVYPDLAKQYHVQVVPFLLQGVAGIERLNQRDGIHPTAEGARIVADNVWTVLRPMLKRT